MSVSVMVANSDVCTVSAESIVTVKSIVMTTFTALFSPLKLFFPNFLNINKIQSMLNKNIKIGTFKDFKYLKLIF
jgi:hypothetical protein